MCTIAREQSGDYLCPNGWTELNTQVFTDLDACKEDLAADTADPVVRCYTPSDDKMNCRYESCNDGEVLLSADGFETFEILYDCAQRLYMGTGCYVPTYTYPFYDIYIAFDHESSTCPTGSYSISAPNYIYGNTQLQAKDYGLALLNDSNVSGLGLDSAKVGILVGKKT